VFLCFPPSFPPPGALFGPSTNFLHFKISVYFQIKLPRLPPTNTNSLKAPCAASVWLCKSDSHAELMCLSPKLPQAFSRLSCFLLGFPIEPKIQPESRYTPVYLGQTGPDHFKVHVLAVDENLRKGTPISILAVGFDLNLSSATNQSASLKGEGRTL
jgi:hypothetical protein